MVRLRVRYRIRFAKAGLLRWTSHRDLARLWERIVRRADLKLSMTEGFHPKPRIGFPSALALGVNGLDEVVELELAERMPVAELFDRLVDDDQPGLTIKSVKRLPDGFGKAQLLRSDYVITIPPQADIAAAEREITQLKSQDTVSFERKKKIVTVDAAMQIPRIEIVDGQLHLSLAASDSASLRPGDVLDLIQACDWIENGALINRTRVVLQKEFETDDPDAIATVQSNPTNIPTTQQQPT
ncbi:MAG: DUF2344 domain-containing protein [Pirellulaceae bacterium]|nr:DUF2344 domain-containing protein [Pirellulaceae bacterium]